MRSHLIYNTGTLWSLFSGPQSNVVFIVLSFLILGGVIFYVRKEQSYNWPFALILAGGVGNLIDRIIFGGVIDFIQIAWWPIFNFADSYLSIGVIWMILLILLEKEKN